MDNQIQAAFNFDAAHQVRVVGTPEQPWFVAADVCDVLGLSNPTEAIRNLDDDERNYITIADTIGRLQKAAIINESGLYALIFRSRKEEARTFRRWVTSEVLPAIRRTGAYDGRQAESPEQFTSPAAHAQHSINELIAELLESRVKAEGLIRVTPEALAAWASAAVGNGLERHPLWPESPNAFARRVKKAHTSLIRRRIGFLRAKGDIILWPLDFVKSLSELAPPETPAIEAPQVDFMREVVSLRETVQRQAEEIRLLWERE